MPARLVGLAPGAISTLQWIAKEEVRICQVAGETANFVDILRSRGLIEFADDAGIYTIITLTADGRRLSNEHHF
jgi:hypothetical protein